MKNALRFLIIAFIVLRSGCSDSPIGLGGNTGQVRFRISNIPVVVVELRATLTRSGDTTLTVMVTEFDSTRSATGNFTGVPVGVWHLSIAGLDIAGVERSGAAYDLEVFASEISSVVGELTGGSAGCVPPPAGLVSWWTGDNTTQDSVGGNNPVWSYNVDSSLPGYVGKTLYFNGVDAHLSFGDAENLKLTQSLSIEGWLYVVSSPPGRAAAQILFRGDDRIGIDPYYLAVMPSGKFRFHISDGTTDVNLEAQAVYGRWVHLAATLNNADGLMTIYVDGNSAATTITTVRPFGDLDPAMTPGVGIGNTQSLNLVANQQPFDGFIDELSVYNTALSAAQVTEIVQAGSHGKCK
jgi:hypothetical protein